MDRLKMIEAIVAEYRKVYKNVQENMLVEALKRIPSDASLIAYAIEIGVDTDALFSKGA